MSDFYTRLPLISRFVDVTDLSHYRAVPEDWWVVITDVKGSTAAIEAGRYRAVNFVGAISIAAALNAVQEDVPFVFGGDGATLLIPESCRKAVEHALAGVQATSEEEFGLALRVGLVPVAEVYAADKKLLVGKYAVSPDYEQSVFMGGGLAYAERLVKDPEAGRGYQLTVRAPATADYTGVECRWKNIESPQEETLALLVEALPEDPAQAAAVYRSVVDQITTIYGPATMHHPVTPSQMRPSFSFRHLGAMEPRVRRKAGWIRWGYTLRIWLQQILLVLFIRFRVTTGTTEWVRYLPKIQETTDVKKFDEMIRMVVAGTAAQRDALEVYLQAAHQRGELVYGIHVADSAVMTCLVYERLGRQVHFVDGADGGYARAASGLKAQRKAHQGMAPAA